MANWLLCDGRVVAPLEIATTLRERCMGLIGRDGFEGALWLKRARSIHTLGMRFAIDIAYCDIEMKVLQVSTIKPARISRYVAGTRSFIEAEAGQFQQWNIQPGSQLEVSEQASEV